jgi:hypothetical protein
VRHTENPVSRELRHAAQLFNRFDYFLFADDTSGKNVRKLRLQWGLRNLTATASVYDGEGFLCGDSFSR